MDKETFDGVSLVVFREITEDDIKKLHLRSNKEGSGGGARDLRFSPASDFGPIFRRMFSEEVPGKSHMRKGKFHWKDEDNTDVRIDLDSKPRKEVRICQAYKCLKNIPDEAGCILMLVQNCKGEVWPYFVTVDSLKNDRWDKEVSNDILGALRTKKEGTAAVGYLDFDDRIFYSNGEFIDACIQRYRRYIG